MYKKTYIFFVYLFIFSSIVSGQTTIISDTTYISHKEFEKVLLVDTLISYAKSFISENEENKIIFSRSGDFTVQVFDHFGYELPASAGAQSRQIKPVEKKELIPGDVMFFEGDRRSHSVASAGIVTRIGEKKNDIEFLYAPSRQQLRYGNMKERYHRKRFISGGRIAEEGDSIAFEVKRGLAVKITEHIKPAKYHKVRSGESLSLISRKYGMSVSDIQQKNNLSGVVIMPDQLLKIYNEEKELNVEKIGELPGDTILIRTIERTEKAQKPLYAINHQTNETIEIGENQIMNFAEADNNQNNAVKKPAKVIHRIKRGESLSVIARKYGCTVNELKRWNNKKGDKIIAGDRLIVYTIKE